MNRLLIAVAVFCLAFPPIPARAGNYTDFMPGVKAMGMGMANTAIADDPFALWYNPGGTANSPYIQAATAMGRMFSPVGNLSFLTVAYTRPYPSINTATIGAGYHAQRQRDSGDKDEFVFHYSQEFKVINIPLLPQLRFNRPVKLGGNFKLLNAEQGRGAGFGFGFDGGLLVRSPKGWSAGVTMRDLNSNVGLPRAVTTYGAAYVWKKWLTFAGDLRVRSNLTEFYPGIEAALYQGLLKLRVGRGLKLDYVNQLALGLGLNFSPLIVDLAMGIPWEGSNRTGGFYAMSLNYKFGAPPFTGTFVGNAAAEAETLRQDIIKLEEKKKIMRSEAEAAAANREGARGEVDALEKRVRELQGDYERVNKRKDEAAYDLSTYELGIKRLTEPPPEPPRVLPKPPPPKKIVWPRSHTVAAGDTLRSIAEIYYGNPALWELIYKSNKDKIERGMPQEGSVLEIPEHKK